MVIYVGGGSASGKSEFAESLITDSGIEKRTYIATMQIWDEDGRRRRERHQKMREGKGFVTVECSRSLDEMSMPGGAVLIDDLTNLFTNEWYADDKELAQERVMSGLRQLADSSELLVIVGNDIFSDGGDYGNGINEYLAALGELNHFAAGLACKVYETVCGIPVLHEYQGVNGGGGMTLIIGGANQGKLHYAQSICVCGSFAQNPQDAAEREIFYGVETWLKESCDPFDELGTLLTVNPDVTIICDEIGCGVVPLGELSREWRVRVGKVCTWLAARAARVIRVYCGIPTVLKDTAGVEN